MAEAIADIETDAGIKVTMNHFLETAEEQISDKSRKRFNRNDNGVEGPSESEERSLQIVIPDTDDPTNPDIVCGICNKSFTRKTSLKRHSLIHSGERPHSCNICNRSFTQKGALKEHMLTHYVESPHIDLILDKPRMDIPFTITTNAAGKLKQHVCPVCGKSFVRKGNLREHITIHTGDRPFVCNICNKSFSRKMNLKEHSLIHSGIKPHLCTYCNTFFTSKGTLNKHILIHTGEKPHVCKLCQKSFNRIAHLKRHALTHTEEEFYFYRKKFGDSYSNMSDSNDKGEMIFCEPDISIREDQLSNNTETDDVDHNDEMQKEVKEEPENNKDAYCNIKEEPSSDQEV